MAYAEATDLTNAIGFQATAMMSSLTATETDTVEELWAVEMEAVLDDVSALIDGMIATRYDPDDVTESAVLKRICIQISVADVWRRYARNETPKTVQDDKAEAMKMLEKIQGGSLALALDDPTEEAEPVESEFESVTRVFDTVML